MPGRRRWGFCDPINAKASKEACDAESINSLFNAEAGDPQSDKGEGCWAQPHDDEPVADCDCDASCKACGFTDAPSGADECISCPDDTYIFKKTNDKKD